MGLWLRFGVVADMLAVLVPLAMYDGERLMMRQQVAGLVFKLWRDKDSSNKGTYHLFDLHKVWLADVATKAMDPERLVRNSVSTCQRNCALTTPTC